jgi:hypothetical protein
MHSSPIATGPNGGIEANVGIEMCANGSKRPEAAMKPPNTKAPPRRYLPPFDIVDALANLRDISVNGAIRG